MIEECTRYHLLRFNSDTCRVCIKYGEVVPVEMSSPASTLFPDLVKYNWCRYSLHLYIPHLYSGVGSLLFTCIPTTPHHLGLSYHGLERAHESRLIVAQHAVYPTPVYTNTVHAESSQLCLVDFRHAFAFEVEQVRYVFPHLVCVPAGFFDAASGACLGPYHVFIGVIAVARGEMPLSLGARTRDGAHEIRRRQRVAARSRLAVHGGIEDQDLLLRWGREGGDGAPYAPENEARD